VTVLGVGIIGAGPVTQAIHLPTLARLGGEYSVTHVMDVDAAAAASVAARVGAAWSTSIAAVLADPSVDVVAICSPPAFHAEQVQAAVAAGVRGILCEKPFAVSRLEAKTLAQMARDARVPLIVGAMHAYDPAWIAARQAWRQLGETAHTVRSSIVLPQNSRYERWATEPLARPPAGVRRPAGADDRAVRLRDAMLGLAIHDVPLIREFVPVLDRVDDAEVLDRFGYAATAQGAGGRVEFFGHMHDHWRVSWTLEAWSASGRLRIDFPPSYVHAGSAVATVETSAGVERFGPFEANGYVEEWAHLARLVHSELQSDDDLRSMVEDLEFALQLAEGPVGA
jgi:predicted dehydrogenase